MREKRLRKRCNEISFDKKFENFLNQKHYLKKRGKKSVQAYRIEGNKSIHYKLKTIIA